MSKISAVILTKNEEEKIIDCIESVSFCDEIIIIDDFSTDRTIDLINNLGKQSIRVIQRKLNGDFSSQRNFALTRAKSDWIFFIDADEIVSNNLKKEIIESVHNQNYDALRLKRVDILFGKKLNHGEIADIYLNRIVKKGKGKWMGKVHERLEVDGKLKVLSNELLHYPHRSVLEFIESINIYTSIRSLELYKQRKNVGLFEIIFFPVGKFFYTYFIRMGFRDGIHGFFLSSMMSWHSFLVRAKLWQLIRSNNASSSQYTAEGVKIIHPSF